MLNSHILQGDGLDFMAKCGPLFDLIVTSPPYNMGIPYNGYKDNRPWNEYEDNLLTPLAWNSFAALREGGRLCVNFPGYAPGKRDAPHHIVFGARALTVGFTLLAEIIWDQGVGARTAWGSWLSPSAPRFPAHHEIIQIWCKGGLKRMDRKGAGDCTHEEFSGWATSIWKFGGRGSKDHPAIFPEELPYRLIKMLTWPGDCVLDPFVGSGTTVCMATRLGRVGVGVEISPIYAKIAEQRLDLVLNPPYKEPY